MQITVSSLTTQPEIMNESEGSRLPARGNGDERDHLLQYLRVLGNEELPETYRSLSLERLKAKVDEAVQKLVSILEN